MVDRIHDVLTPNPVGERLRTAREAKGLSLDDVATMTRVPIRHLLHIEKGEWDSLPAITYSVGFARSYAKAVGLNGSEVGAELRAQLGDGGQSNMATASYQPADPARVPPRTLSIIAAVIAIILIGGYFIWRSNTLGGGDPETEAAAFETPIGPEAAPNPAVRPRAAPAAPSAGPVVLTATDDVWLRVSEADGSVLFQDTLKRGARFQVPATARAPQLRVGRPDALAVSVGQASIPQLGPAGRPIGNVSLLATDLIARAQGAAPAPQPAPPTR